MNQRIADFPVQSLFIKRHSPRALADTRLEEAVLMQLFEAARWAPSSYNNQPWRYVYAYKGSQAWQAFYDAQVAFNKEWTQRAPVLVVIISRTLFTYNNKPSRTHSFDTGASWMSFALQGSLLGLVVHAMEGFDYDAIRKHLQLPTEYEILAMVAVGYPGDVQKLPEAMRAEDQQLSDRRHVADFAFQDVFKE